MSFKYHAPTNSIVIPPEDLRMISLHIYAALRGIREIAGLPLDRYESPVTLTAADHAQQRLIALSRDLGIDLGAEWANEIDLRPVTR